jgi:GT2 family glycosyltransferase
MAVKIAHYATSSATTVPLTRYDDPTVSGAAEPGLVSFVVIAYNEQAGIARTLQSILGQSAAVALEVIVIDDGSRDGTTAIVGELAARDPRVRLIELGENRGRGFARQAGVEATRGEYVATVDADIVLGTDWLARCLAALDDADAVGGRAIPDGDAAFHYRRFRLTPRIGGEHSVPVTGANAVFRADVFRKVAFDPELREGEDVAINHALTAAGTRMFMVPDLTVLHEETKSYATSLRWMFQSGRGAERQLRTYRQFRMPDLAYFVFLATVGLGLAGLLRGRRWAAFAPATFLSLTAVGHVHGAYVWTPRETPAFSGAILADTLLLLCYFAGRICGPPPAASRGQVPGGVAG